MKHRSDLVWMMVLAVGLGACQQRRDPAGGAAATQASAVAGAQGAPDARRARGVLEIRGGDGESDLRLDPETDGYRIKTARGTLAGSVKADRGRVKLLSAQGVLEAKAKAKDYGYKVYDETNAEVLKAKRRGDGYLYKTGQDVDLGRWERGQGIVAGQEVRVESRDGRHVVLRGGQPVGSASLAVPARAAALLALTELPFEQRLAALIYEVEVDGL